MKRLIQLVATVLSMDGTSRGDAQCNPSAATAMIASSPLAGKQA